MCGTVTILVVEDEDIIRTIAAEALGDAGYTVLEASDAHGALEILKERAAEVAVLFSDIRMPGAINGVELAEAVNERWPRIQLLLTSGDTHLLERDVPDHGHFIPKPYRLQRIVDEIQKLLQQDGLSTP